MMKNQPFLYVVFAGIAILVNLITQHLVLNLSRSSEILGLSLLSGTVMGLIIKYFLDKKWIFYDPETSVKSHGRKFVLYALMGLFTTAIFWGIETLFWLFYRSDIMRDVGAVIGLIIGYFTKYKLDKRFVFLPLETGEI